MTEPQRLAKRIAEMRSCSRREAEQYITGGWVTVNGVVVEEPHYRVIDQLLAVAPDANPLALPPVTLLMHKPAGLDAMPSLADQWSGDASGIRPLKKHITAAELATPLGADASGLVVLTGDARVLRKLRTDAATLEHELVVRVTGSAPAGGFERLAHVDHGLRLNGVPVSPAKISWQSENCLRFALKAVLPGQIALMCKSIGLTVQAIKRIRIGRVPLRNLPVGQWRYLLPHERF